MDKKNREAEEIVAEMESRHRDVMEPVIERINELQASGDGDGIWYLYTTMVTLAGCIQDLVKSRPIFTPEQIAKAGGDPKKCLS